MPWISNHTHMYIKGRMLNHFNKVYSTSFAVAQWNFLVLVRVLAGHFRCSFYVFKFAVGLSSVRGVRPRSRGTQSTEVSTSLHDIPADPKYRLDPVPPSAPRVFTPGSHHADWATLRLTDSIHTAVYYYDIVMGL